MISDSFVEHEWDITPGGLFFIETDDEDELRSRFRRGQHPHAGNYGFSRLFCWVEDSFGINWQLNPSLKVSVVSIRFPPPPSMVTRALITTSCLARTSNNGWFQLRRTKVRQASHQLIGEQPEELRQLGANKVSSSCALLKLLHRHGATLGVSQPRLTCTHIKTLPQARPFVMLGLTVFAGTTMGSSKACNTCFPGQEVGWLGSFRASSFRKNTQSRPSLLRLKVRRLRHFLVWFRFDRLPA